MARQQQQTQQRQQGGSNMPARLTQPADTSYPEIAVEYGIDKPLWHALSNLYPGAHPNSVAAVYDYCAARKLDPLKKPVHIVPMYIEDKTTGQKAMRDVIMPGIQEMRTTAARTNAYAGQDPVVLGPMIRVPVTNAADAPDNVNTYEVPQFATVTVYKLVQGKRYPYTHTEYFLEAVARKQSGQINEMWQKRPIGQLSKCAEAGALRKAFPEELGGEYAAEEMEGREEFIQLEGLPAEPEHGASGIPAPETKAAAETLPPPPKLELAPEAKPAAEPDRDAAALARLDARQAATQQASEPERTAAAEPVVAATQDAHEPEPAADISGLTIDLPAGARGVLERMMATKGITEAQLLAKLGTSVAIANVNEALAACKSWSA